MDHSDDASPEITAVVCTRNRGESIASTVRSILASKGIDFELLVIDQSDGGETRRALEPFLQDRRMRYVPTSSRGLGRARNVSLELTRSDRVAFTDDDVVVPDHWLRTVAGILARHPDVSVGFVNVAAGEHDPALGFVPSYMRHGSKEVRGMIAKCRARGIGAGLFVRRAPVLALGGFDPSLGAGGRFPSCEDGDMAVRALLAGQRVLETDEVAVVHDGFRTFAEGVQLTARDWVGIGAAYAKPIKAGRLSGLAVVLYEGVYQAIVRPLMATFRVGRPRGLKRGWYFWRGFFQGLRTPMDRATMLYIDEGPS